MCAHLQFVIVVCTFTGSDRCVHIYRLLSLCAHLQAVIALCTFTGSDRSVHIYRL